MTLNCTLPHWRNQKFWLGGN